MPTPWKRSPKELHKTYIANTEAFYKVAGRGIPAFAGINLFRQVGSSYPGQ